MMDTATAARRHRAARSIGRNVAVRRASPPIRASLAPGDLFVALKGERFDGHDFVAAALAARRRRGAGRRATAPAALARQRCIAVADPLRRARHARRALARALRAAARRRHRQQRQDDGQGNDSRRSCARTSAPTRVLATAGNLNNDIGLPLTLLRLARARIAVAVIEIGMNHRRRDRASSARSRSRRSRVVNNAQREHQEFMHSVGDVAAEHATLLARAAARRHRGHQRRRRARSTSGATPRATRGRRACVDFALDAPAAVTARVRGACRRQRARRSRRPPASRQRRSARCRDGTTCATRWRRPRPRRAAGAPLAAVAQGLAAFRPVAGRLQAQGRPQRRDRDRRHATTPIPDSVRAAIDVLAARAGPRRGWCSATWARSATQGPAFHREIGAYARAARHRPAARRWATLAPRRGRRVRRRARALRRRSRRCSRASRATLRPGIDGAGQGLALHADGARRRRARPATHGGSALMLLCARRTGSPRTSARSTSSATSRCARCSRRMTALVISFVVGPDDDPQADAHTRSASRCATTARRRI